MTPEQEAREKINNQLKAAGWGVFTSKKITANKSDAINSDNFIQSKKKEYNIRNIVSTLVNELKVENEELLSRYNTYKIKIPVTERIVEQKLKNYHKYISELKDKLEENAKEKLNGCSIA